ncbi:transcription elongation factor [Nonlabens spongiae]|uniref:Transcription elongation factor n=1 Tax=Nonlabens spongiae TaxID=331648 RepID=A0A1W6MHA7_9FLAO|nr:transcription elongation factor [Nonlabens spongiae]ARN76967.1 transcription elongation factor [Nonlabens spongiae]
MSEFKKAINTKCLEIVAERLDIIDDNLKNLQHSKQSETKSSAGDKYETGRAMIQNQEELYRRQRHQTQIILDQLLKIDPDKKCKRVEDGALVTLPSGHYYISAGMGKLTVNEKDVFALSLASPLGMALKHRHAGDTFTFNEKEHNILQIV